MAMVVQTSDQRSKGETASQNSEVAVSSDSLSLLQKSFKATEEHAAMLRERFEEKKKQAGSAVMCGTCGKKMKNKTGLKRHWSAKGNKCSSENGFKEVADVEVTSDDRMTDRDRKMAKMLAAARQAQIDVDPDRNSRRKTSDGIDAARLMRYPLGNFDRVLREAETSELEKFTQMRFDKNTAPKKILAEKELERRASKG